jgi:membrane peptidoglycan carboxypeptidase
VTLFELARAYTAFATGGRRLDPIFITKITDPHGKVLEEFQAASDPVIAPETAYLITSMLESVIQRGTGKRVAALGRPVAGKTGTTNDMHDAWFVGYTPELLTGVWVGYDSERSLGKEQTGGRVAAPIFLSFMEAALGTTVVNDFPIPEGVALVSVNGELECFKKGSEPQARLAGGGESLDELDRAVARLRGREPAELDGEQGLAPAADDFDHEEPTWAPDAAEMAPAHRDQTPQVDDRPPPRAQDYIDAGRTRGGRDTEYRSNDNEDREIPAPPKRRPIAQPPDDYRVNAPVPTRGRKIVEEPLPY